MFSSQFILFEVSEGKVFWTQVQKDLNWMNATWEGRQWKREREGERERVQKYCNTEKNLLKVAKKFFIGLTIGILIVNNDISMITSNTLLIPKQEMEFVFILE